MTDKEKLIALVDQFASGNQQAFADLIGVPRSSIATWLHRGSITAGGREAILDAFPQVSREWLQSGSTTTRRTSSLCSPTLHGTGGELPMLAESPATIHFSRHDLIPLFEESRASCGIVEQLDNPNYQTGFLHLPGTHARAALRAEGISMEPTIHDGDLCLVGDEVTLSALSPQRIYLIVTRDGHCMFKRIQDEGPAAKDILALSENPAYTPRVQAVAKADIVRLMPLRYVVHEMD